MKSRHIKAQITSFCFILPALTVLALLLLYPVITSVYYSFTSKHLIKTGYEFVFLKNYIAVLTDGDFWKSFLTNIKWTVTSLFFQILVGFFAALALERIGKGKSFFRTVLIIPWAFPPSSSLCPGNGSSTGYPAFFPTFWSSWESATPFPSSSAVPTWCSPYW